MAGAKRPLLFSDTSATLTCIKESAAVLRQMIVDSVMLGGTQSPGSRIMRSLLVALDNTPAGAATIKLALSLATRHRATLTGLGVLDIDYLTSPEPRQIRTAYYKFKADLIRLKGSRAGRAG
jgi:hypothetical protein